MGKLQQARVQVQHEAVAGMNNAAEGLFSRSQAAVPRRTGALAQSGKITNVDRGNTMKRIISYGDDTRNPNTGLPTSKYALLVHEVYNAQSPNNYKWLERTVHQQGKEVFMAALTAHLRGVL